jgi:uncharacterized protein
VAFQELPPFAAWRHRDARDGFEVVFLHSGPEGHRLEGHTAAVEAGEAWSVHYSIVVDANWLTQTAQVVGQSATGRRELRLEADRAGSWRINGTPAPELDGCLDVDLESSSLTNALPVHRLGIGIGQYAEAPAAYVRALDLAVERLEQRYVRTDDEGVGQRYDYSAPRFEYTGLIGYDVHGLVLDYPGIAVRAA